MTDLRRGADTRRWAVRLRRCSAHSGESRYSRGPKAVVQTVKEDTHTHTHQHSTTHAPVQRTHSSCMQSNVTKGGGRRRVHPVHGGVARVEQFQPWCGSSVIGEAVPRIRARQGPTSHSTRVPQGMGWSAIPRTGRKTEDADVAASGTAPERQARPPGAACLVAAVVGTPSPSSGHDKSGVRHAAPGTLVTGRSAAPTMSRGADGADVAAS